MKEFKKRVLSMGIVLALMVSMISGIVIFGTSKPYKDGVLAAPRAAWSDVNFGNFEAANSLDGANNPTETIWHKQNDSTASDKNATLFRSTARAISGTASVVFTSQTSLQWQLALRKNFGAQSERFVRGVEAITFQIRTKNAITLNLNFWQGNAPSSQYGLKKAITGSNDIQTITVPLASFIRINGVGQEGTVDFVTDMGERLYTNSQTVLRVLCEANGKNEVILDNFAQTKLGGYVTAPVNNEISDKPYTVEESIDEAHTDYLDIADRYTDNENVKTVWKIKDGPGVEFPTLDSTTAAPSTDSNNKSIKLSYSMTEGWGYYRWTAPSAEATTLNNTLPSHKAGFITFWAKGTEVSGQSLAMGVKFLDNDYPYTREIYVTNTWQQYKIPFTDLTKVDTKVPLSSKTSGSFEQLKIDIFGTNNASIWIDTIAFVGEGITEIATNIDTMLYNISATSDGNGTVSGGGSFAKGTSTTLTATPNNGYIFDGWYKNNVKVSSSQSYTFSVTGSGVYEARFINKTPTITVNTNQPDSTSVYGGGTYELNSKATIQASSKSGSDYIFEKWINSASNTVSTSATYSFNVTKAETYTAIFKQVPKFNVTITSNGGTVSGLNELGYKYTQVATLTAIPSEGYKFIGWIDNNQNGKVLSIEKTFEFSVTENTSLTASFATVDEFIVNFIDIDGRIFKAEKVTSGLSATAPENISRMGYKFIGWDKEFTNITADTTIRAIFEAIDMHTITVTGGKLEDLSTSGEFLFNTIIYATANTAPEGKVFSHWEVNGILFSTDAKVKLFVTADQNLVAIFANVAIEAKPFITLADGVKINTELGKISFTAQANMAEGYTLVECGILLLKSNTKPQDLSLNTESVLKCNGTKLINSTGQFIVTKGKVLSTETYYARAYLIYKDRDGSVFTVYSENTVSGSMN